MKKFIFIVLCFLSTTSAFGEAKCYTDDKGQYIYLDQKNDTAMFAALLSEPSPNDFRCSLYGELAKNNSEFRGIASDETLPDVLPCAISVRQSKDKITVEMLSDTCIQIFECGAGMTTTPRTFSTSKPAPLDKCEKPEDYMGEGGGTKPDRSTYK